MLERFIGSEGRRRLADALARQSTLIGSSESASSLAQCCEVQTLGAGGVILEQGASDNHLYFILSGSFSVLVNGREVARRFAEQHVGEMAMIDPKARRSATVLALEESVVARISEPDFATLATVTPLLWKNLAVELADRLRQRNRLVGMRNDLPHIFLGSSKESLVIADGIQAGLARDPYVVTVWTNGVFGPSQFPIQALERTAQESDFAALVLGPDDHITSRDEENFGPRDNVILELGLFIGAFGHERVFLLV